MELKDTALASLRQGQPPDIKLLEALTVGRREGILDFWESCYLEDYIPHGGSKVKFLIGRAGSGKTHTILLLKEAARRLGYISVFIDARSVRLNQFNTIYQAVLDTVEVDELVGRYCSTVIESLGYQPESLPEEKNFFDWAVEQGRVAESLKRDIRERLELLFKDKKINNNFASAFIQLCAIRLGMRPQGKEQKEYLEQWLKGQPVPARELRRLQVFARLDKYNARHMLGSLLQVARLCGYKGLFAAIDGLEVLMEKGPTGRALYGRSGRNEVYESLRQLIDDSAGFEGVFFVFAARPDIVHDEKAGFKAYEALWMRIQNEVSGQRPNKFADLLDLDELVKEFFTEGTCIELQQKMSEVFGCCIDGVDFPAELTAVSMVSPVRRVIMALASSCKIFYADNQAKAFGTEAETAATGEQEA